MITQHDPRIETQPAYPPAGREPDRRRFARPPELALAGLQLIVGYAWLLAGVDKLLLSTFPAQMGGLLRTAVGSGRLPGFFVRILSGLVMPNATIFGFLIEWGEALAGLALLSAGLIALLGPLAKRYSGETPAAVFPLGARLLERLALLAAIGAGLLGLSYFLLDGAPLPWFAPSIAFGGAIDTGLFLAAASVVLIVSQVALWPHRR